MPRPSIVCLLVLAAASAPASAKDLRVLVSGIASSQGTIRCLLFDRERGFPERLDRAVAQVDYPAAEGLLTCTFPEVAPGRYAVAVLHDLDDDGEFDTDFEGDGEPWGTTNNLRPGDRAPTFVESVIYMGSTADYEVEIRP